MGFIRDLFSKKHILETATDAVVNTGDMLVFTEEEKAIANQKLLDWKLEYQKATSPQNLSRRYIAVIISVQLCFLVALVTGLSVFGRTLEADYVFKILSEVVMQPFSIVIGFYFLSHVVGKLGK